jgi:hypothetical protein
MSDRVDQHDLIHALELDEVTIDEIDFHPVLKSSRRDGTQVVRQYEIGFAVPWQGRPRTDYLFARSGKVTNAVARQEIVEEQRFRRTDHWHFQSNQTFLGRDQWLTWSQEPYASDRGRSFPSSQAGLRWLFLCASFYRLRAYHGAYSVSEFLTNIEELANRKEPFHSARSYEVLCEFSPEESAGWQVYRESRKLPRFKQVFAGPEAAARDFIRYHDEDDDYSPRTLILLDPKNVIRQAKLYAS